MAFKKAERTRLYLRCALFGPSGSGKTMTALRMAKGIAGKMGVPYAFIDSESRSASKYADRFDFVVDDLEKKDIDHYIASMEAAKKAGYKVLVIDSLTHAWRELTEEADRIVLTGNSKSSLTPWKKLNPKQERLKEAILNYPGHVIVTMRSKTEWVIGTGKDGKIAPEKLGLAPVQGKEIEYEFDLLIEFSQHHIGTVTKDRTGKFQDETIDKPGEDFGVALYDWLISGTEVKPEAAAIPPSQPVKKPTTANTAKPHNTGISLKERSTAVINEIADIVTASGNGAEYFSEDERNEARQLIHDTKLNEDGMKELLTLKDFLADERDKRCKKAA